jgi:uncharacterized membrane protein YgcG
MKNVLPILVLALLGTACRSVEPSADPYFHDGVYALHDGGHDWIEESTTETDSSYYDEYVIDYVPGEAAISPYNAQPTYMGYYGSDLYQNSYYNDTYWNGGYSSPFFNPFAHHSHCGMGWNWNFLFGFSYHSYYWNPYLPYYYGYQQPYYTSNWIFSDHGYVNAPRNHQLYGYSMPGEGGGTQTPGGNYGRLRTMVIDTDAQNVQRMDRGFGAWIERMAEAPSNVRRDGTPVRKERTGFRNFMHDVSRGIEGMQGSTPDRDSDGKPSTGKSPKVGSPGKSPSKGSGGSGGRSGGGSRGGSKGGGGR